MRRFVVLKHRMPDGSEHFDWMLELGESRSPDDRTLLTFRTDGVPTEDESFDAERIGDHRALYLAYEGEIDGGRGRVTRLVAGRAEVLELDLWSAVFRLHVGERCVCLAGASTDGRHYRFVRRHA